MANTLHNVVVHGPCGHLQLVGHGIRLRGERMIARRSHRVRDAGEDLIIHMSTRLVLAMHDRRRVAHGAAVHLGERLHAEADTEHGRAGLCTQANHVLAHA